MTPAEYTAIIIAMIGIIPGIVGVYRNVLQSNNTEQDMLLGLAHWAIVSEAKNYIDRGWITTSELESFHVLVKPYLALGGNGVALKMVEELHDIPSRPPRDN